MQRCEVAASWGVFLEPEGLVDLSAWRARQEKRLKELEKLAAGSEKKLANPRFVERAPREVVDAERARLKEAQEQIARIRENLARLG